MKKLLFILTILISKNAGAFDHKTLLKTDLSWDGERVEYIATNAEISAISIKIKPSEVMPFHCHPAPSFGQIISGDLQVEKMNGEKKIFKKGDVLVEVVNTWHRGRNLSDKEGVEILAFYAGSNGVENTIFYNEENKNKCSQ